MIHYYYQARQWGRHGVGTAAEWDPVEVVARLAAESAVVIFSRSKCCMCHAVKRLFHGMGVGPAVHELDRDQHGKEIEGVLAKFLGSSRLVPVVFVGGRLVGSMDREFDGPLYWAEIYLTGPDGGPYHYC